LKVDGKYFRSRISFRWNVICIGMKVKPNSIVVGKISSRTRINPHIGVIKINLVQFLFLFQNSICLTFDYLYAGLLHVRFPTLAGSEQLMAN
jgi:hypothetical protein